jgi:hypothetical protein
MGNNNSNLVCCIGPTDGLINKECDNYKGESSNTHYTTKTSVSSSKKEPVREGYSFSSISSKSSSCCNDDHQDDEMRNDAAEWCHSYSQEIRVAESSYDEAATEAVNHYHGHSRQYSRGRDGSQQIRDQ